MDSGDIGDQRSLVDDIEDLLVNARTWLDAEFTYQKTRASFVAASLRSALVCAIVAGVIALLAAIGLVVGLILALSPYLTMFGATAAVVFVLLLICALLLATARQRMRDITEAVREKDGNNEDPD